MTMLKSLLVFAVAFYLGVVALIYVMQRSLMYFPETVRTAPADAGLPEAQEVVLDTADGERIIVWHVAPHADKPVVLDFHGNGGALRYRIARYRPLVADGFGLVAVSYRGYGGSSGRPSEDGLFEDANAAYAFAKARYPAEGFVFWGESLGTGVAVALAAVKPAARLVLEAPFSSAVDVAASAYPFVPVRWLMKDTFRSDLRIAKVTAPVLTHSSRRPNASSGFPEPATAISPRTVSSRRPRASSASGSIRRVAPIATAQIENAGHQGPRRVSVLADIRSEARPARRATAPRSASAASAARTAHDGLWLHRQEPFALHALAGELAGPADRLRPLARFFLGWLLVVAAQLHFAENALALHLFLERLEGLIDVVVPDENLHAAYLLR